MGGRGGYGFIRRNITEQQAEWARAAGRTQQSAAQAHVAELLQHALRDLNQVDTDSLNRHKDTILDALRDVFDGAYDLRGGGSYTRHTYVNGYSDVDVLLDLGNFTDSDVPNKDNPSAVLRDMERRLRQRLPMTEISSGRMAVTVRFSDGNTIQVLPAFKYHSGYRVPSPDGQGWTVTRPRVFAQQLTDRNAQMGGNLLPCIKLAKLICQRQGVGIKSYHLENIAVVAFSGYTGSRDVSEMLQHLFNQAKTLVPRPMRDVTGQDSHVDGYLRNMTQRRALAQQLASLEGQVLSAEDNPSAWRTLLGSGQ